MWQLHAADIGGIFHYARAVLAKWGQPALAAQQAGATGKCMGPRCMASSANGYAHSRECIDEAAETQGWTPTANDYAKCGFYTPGRAAPQPVARVPLDEARRMFDAGWKAAALFCDREDVVADGIIGFGACPQFEAAFSAARARLEGKP